MDRACSPGRKIARERPAQGLCLGHYKATRNSSVFRRAGDCMFLPVHDKARAIKAFGSFGLPTRIVCHWTEDGDCVVVLTVHQELCLGGACINQVRLRQQILVSERP